MNCYLDIDSEFHLSAEELASAWNASDYPAKAEVIAQLDSSRSFSIGEVTMLLLSAAASIPAAVIATFITDYLKRKFPGKKPPAIEVTTIYSLDGEPIFFIRKEIEHPEP